MVPGGSAAVPSIVVRDIRVVIVLRNNRGSSIEARSRVLEYTHASWHG